MTTIDNYAFSNCSSLTKVTIPNSVTLIKQSAFWNCNSLKYIEVDENNTNYCSKNGILFNSDKTSLIKYPAGKENKSYTIPNSVTSIGGDAFNGCSSLTEMNIPNSVTKIEEYAFWDCSSLNKVTIPNSVTEIGYRAFGSCYLISDIYSLASIPPTLENDVFSEHPADAVLHVPAEAVDAYSQADQWRDFIIKAIDETGLDYIEADGCNGTAKYYKLNGVEADGEALSPGVYIKKQGDKATKVLIK